MLSKKLIILIGALAGVFGALAGVYAFLFAAPGPSAEREQFTVAIGKDDSREVAAALAELGFIKSSFGFRLAFFGVRGASAIICIDCIQPGAYKLSKSMSAFAIAQVLKKDPYMKWVAIPEGWRKEQIAERLARELGWSGADKRKWVSDYTAMEYDYVEGVYFPDTYLIPTDEKPLDVAERLRTRFDEQFAPYAQEALDQNIKWTTIVTLASLIQREAGGADDMPLIAGILWSRLLQGMKLDIDATLQYARDSEIAYADLCKAAGSDEPYQCQCADEPVACYRREGFYKGLEEWWRAPDASDKQIESEYNTYRRQGLPPHPIANPGIGAIEAVLFPEETNCLFYLHDKYKQIHCSKTYAGHLENIETYLRSSL